MKNLLVRIVPWITEPHHEAIDGSTAQQRAEFARTATRTASLLLAFVMLQRVMLRVCRPPEVVFEQGSILLACFRHRALLFTAGLMIVLSLLIAFPRLRQGWSQFENGALLRALVGVLAAMMAWTGSAYAYNFWYDEPHLVDRAALLLLAGLVWWRPAFTLPLAAAFWAIIWQFNYPSLGFQTLEAAFRPAVNLVTLFSAALLIRAPCGGRRMDGFLFLALCLVAANFWVPGYGKLRMGWVTHGHAYFLLPDAYTHGWLAFLAPETVASMTRMLASLDWPSRIFVLIIECGALFLFVSARVARIFLLLFTLLLGVFFLTLGYLFWQWMVIQTALWIVVFGSGERGAVWRQYLFTRSRFAVSLVVIWASSHWFQPARLAWFDTPVANMLRYEAIGSSRAAYDLPPSFFAPYESHIAMARFVAALTPAPVLTDSYGVTGDRAIAEALLRARTPDDVTRLEASAIVGELGVDTEYARRFDEFIRRAVEVSNRHLAEGGRGSEPLSLVRPPLFLWTFQRGTPYRHEEPIASVRVYRTSSFFDGHTYSVFRRELLREISLLR
jgi:hypothetical protein